MTFQDVERYIREVRARPTHPTPEEVKDGLSTLKREALDSHDEAGAKLAWCLGQALMAQNLYLQAFARMKQAQFYDAWCDLEKAELALRFLEPHGAELWVECCLDFIQEYVSKWQSLFPYKIFLSPGMIALEKVCSTCGARVMPRRPCGHIVGEIYGGEMCCRIVTDMKPLEVSLVENPVQKYSVVFLTDPKTGEKRDHYNYGLAKYAINALRSPFDEWEPEWTTRRHPHSYFRHVGRNDPCPCGSKKKYKKCCMLREGVLRPHVQFRFAVPPPEGTPVQGFVE